eukprot:9120724-Pyramimonas_sp.AAC.1
MIVAASPARGGPKRRRRVRAIPPDFSQRNQGRARDQGPAHSGTRELHGAALSRDPLTAEP